MHALWSPSVVTSLPLHVQGALVMTESEQAALLGELAPSRGSAVTGADSGSNIEHNKVKEIRTWLKGVRDAGYDF